MNCHIYKSAELRSFVHNLWALTGTHTPGCAEPVDLVPSGFLELIFNYGERSGNSGSQTAGFLQGQRTSHSVYEPSAYRGFIAAMIKPQAAYLLLGIPADQVRNARVDAYDIFGSSIEQLYDELSAVNEVETGFLLVERFLKERIIKNYQNEDRAVNAAVQLISDFGGILKIDSLAERTGLTNRSIQRKFRKCVGLTPKEFARVVRFQRALAIKQRDTGINLTGLAYEAGYSDQAHFTHEFTGLSGYSPKDYFKLYPASSDYFS